MDPFLPDAQKVAALRDLLPSTGAGIGLDVPTAGPSPAETDRALREADDWEQRVGRGGPDHAADADLRRLEARGVLAAILGWSPDLVTPVMGLGSAVTALLLAAPVAVPRLSIEPGVDPAVADAARSVARARGWEVGRAEEAGVALAPAIRADDGMPADLRALRERMPTAALLAADLSLAVGAIEVAGAPPWSAAMLATDRWLLGPEGSAAIVRTSGSWPAPIVDPLPRRVALGVGRSVGWLLMYVGMPWILARTAALAARARTALAAIPGVHVRGGTAAASPVLVFTMEGWTAEEAADELGRRVFAITGRTPGGGELRIGVGAWTTEAELDRFTDAVAELAAHTPSSLPRRPALTVLGHG